MAAGPVPVDTRADLYDCPVVESRSVGAYRLVSFTSRELAALARPGQFLMVREAGPQLDPLLPRPLGIHAVDSDLMSILIEPKGKGTRALADVRMGDRLEVLGPLGHGFDLTGSGPAVIAGGGIGVAPLAYLARELAAAGRAVNCFLGFRSRHEAVAAELFRGLDVEIMTEDGSLGTQGLATQSLAAHLKNLSGEGGNTAAAAAPAPEIFACGPSPMLKAVAEIAIAHVARAQVSVDSHMACGVGACQGCVVKAAGGFRKVCTDGPVFETGVLEW